MTIKDKKIINRKCVVCDKNIRITLNKNGYYNNGHYFDKLKVPIRSTGEYKRVGTSKLFDEKVNVVKWTGKEKEVEYWECNKCYEKVKN